MATLLHELWQEPDGRNTFCLAGPMGREARRLLGTGAKLIWTVNAGSHFEAMTKYYSFMGWGEYTSDRELDREPYPEEWQVRLEGAGD